MDIEQRWGGHQTRAATILGELSQTTLRLEKTHGYQADLCLKQQLASSGPVCSCSSMLGYQ